jgi:hypothetical protein
MKELRRMCRTAGDWVRQVPSTIIGAYRNQAVLAFDALPLALAAAGTAYCFVLAAPGLSAGVALGSVMGTLILRSAFTHPIGRDGKLHPSSPWQNSMDSFTDAMLAVLNLLFCQGVLQLISRDTTVSLTALKHGIAIFVPGMYLLRLNLRPRPSPGIPFRGSNLTSDQIYKRTRWLNVLWLVTCQWTVVANPHSLPDWLPQWNLIRNVFPMQIFMVWFRIQQNAFSRRDYYETLFSDWEKKKKARQRELLIKGMDERDPYFWLYRPLQGALFLYLATPMLFTLWPWLSGTADLDVYEIAFQIVALLTLASTWNYLKDANRAAAAALEADIK